MTTMINESSEKLSSWLSPETFIDLETESSSLEQDLVQAFSLVTGLSLRYEEMKGMRSLLDDAEREEKDVHERIAREMGAMISASIRINDELTFIVSERDKIRLKAKNDFQPLPLPELLELKEMSPNYAWHNLRQQL